MSRVRKHALALVCTWFLAAAPALAQDATGGPNPGGITITGSFDLSNRYMFRGIRQNSTEVAFWPATDLAIAAYSGDGGLKSVGINFGTWNSLHSGDTGADGPSGEPWYESDFYASLGFGFAGGASITTTYTAYTSPNNGFSTVKEVMVKVALDDSGHLGKGAIRPYVAVAREFDTGVGLGQADGGLRAGTYLELGVAPGYAGDRVGVAFPVKVGVSLNDYYELSGVDNTFGFLSVSGIATVPLGGTTSLGSWNLHGGVEYQRLGETTAAINGLPRRFQMIGVFGFGFSY